MHASRSALILVVVGIGACSGAPSKIGEGRPLTNSSQRAGSNAPERLAYAGTAFAGNWRATATFKTKPGGKPVIDVSAEIDLRFAARADERSALDVFAEALVLHGEVAGNRTNLALRASDPAYTELLATPLHAITLGADGTVSGAPNPANLMARQGGHLIATAVFLIPSLPDQPVEVGTSWTAARLIPKSSNAGPEVHADIHYRLAAITPCAQAGRTSRARCATITSDADTGTRTMDVDGKPTTIRYQLTGTSNVELDGALTNASANMDMAMTIGGMPLDLSGVVTFDRR